MAARASQSERQARIEQRMDHLESDVTNIKADVRELRDALLQGKGSWKVAAVLVGLAASIAASLIATWVLHFFGPRNGSS